MNIEIKRVKIGDPTARITHNMSVELDGSRGIKSKLTHHTCHCYPSARPLSSPENHSTLHFIHFLFLLFYLLYFKSHIKSSLKAKLD